MSSKPALLLHTCCGPCATAVVERLVQRFEVTGFWHNPNIQPPAEHTRRLEQAHIVARQLDIDLIVDEADDAVWAEAVAQHAQEPEGGRRCPVCFEYRIDRAARCAARLGFEHVATTLSVSPHKPADTINDIGRRVAQALGVNFLAEDFKHGGGFQRSVELSKRMNLYRQRYCGCLFAAPRSRQTGPEAPRR